MLFEIITSKNNTLANVGVMVVHRLRRWPNIKPATVQNECAVFSGL